MLEETIHNFRERTFPWKFMYPPEWHILKIAFSSTAMRPIKAWLFVVPFVAGLISVFPIEFVLGNVQIILGNKFQAPFSFFLSYVAAVLYIAAYVVFWIKCPNFVSRLDAKFDKIPENTTRTEIVECIRQQVTNCFPNTVKTGTGKTYTRRGPGYFLEQDQETGQFRPISLDTFLYFLDYWESNAKFWERKILHENGRRVVAIGTEKINTVYSEIGGYHRDKHPAKDLAKHPFLFDQLFFPNLRIKERQGDRDAMAAMSYTALYISLSESKPVSRIVVGLLLLISSIIGVYLVFQIIVRGFLLFSELI